MLRDHSQSWGSADLPAFLKLCCSRRQQRLPDVSQFPPFLGLHLPWALKDPLPGSLYILFLRVQINGLSSGGDAVEKRHELGLSAIGSALEVHVVGSRVYDDHHQVETAGAGCLVPSFS